MVLWRDVEPARVPIKVNGRTPGIRYFVAFLFDGDAAPMADRARERLWIDRTQILAANCSAILTSAWPAPAPTPPTRTRVLPAPDRGGPAQWGLGVGLWAGAPRAPPPIPSP